MSDIDDSILIQGISNLFLWVIKNILNEYSNNSNQTNIWIDFNKIKYYQDDNDECTHLDCNQDDCNQDECIQDECTQDNNEINLPATCDIVWNIVNNMDSDIRATISEDNPWLFRGFVVNHLDMRVRTNLDVLLNELCNMEIISVIYLEKEQLYDFIKIIENFRIDIIRINELYIDMWKNIIDGNREVTQNDCRIIEQQFESINNLPCDAIMLRNEYKYIGENTCNLMNNFTQNILEKVLPYVSNMSNNFKNDLSIESE